MRMHFNSTMVRLKAFMNQDGGTASSNFNSTMVRLKAVEEHADYCHTLFQFHYGTIKREVAPASFHKV